MKIALMTQPGQIEFKDVAAPRELKDNEVLLKIKRIGICGSDIHVYDGEHPAVVYPVIQGHEYSAVVEKVGKDVTNIKSGMRATARPQETCGTCAPCLRGDYNVCQNLKVEGFQAPGAAQEYFIVPADRVIPFPENVSFDQGAMIEPVSVAAHSSNRAKSLKGKNVVVSGAGTIGNLVAQFAKIRGAKKVAITDVSDYRLQIAKECGVEHTINVRNNSFETEIKKIFGEEGFQVGLEAAGVPASLDALVKNIENGGEIVIIGVYAHNPVVNMYYLGEHELQLTGSMMYKQEDYSEAVNNIANGKIKLEPLMSKHFPFDDFLDAYHFIKAEREKAMKVFVDM